MAERTGARASVLAVAVAVAAVLVAACGDSPKRSTSSAAATTTSTAQATTGTATGATGTAAAPATVETPESALPARTVTGAAPRHTAPLGSLPATSARLRLPEGEETGDEEEQDSVGEGGRPRVASNDPDGALDPGTDLRAAPGALARFTGTRDDGHPPDAVGAIGATQYVLATNRKIVVLGRDGTQLASAALGVLWQSAGGRCASNPRGDPALIYDEDGGRFALSQFAFEGKSSNGTETFQCIAVSDTGDALGKWTVFSWSWGLGFHDYPKLGVAPGAYALTAYSHQGNQDLTRMALVDRAALLAGTKPTVQMFDVGTGWRPLIPADIDGTMPAAGSPAVFAGIRDDAWSATGSGGDQVVMVQAPVDFSAQAVEAKVTRLQASAFDSTVCDGALECIAQPGTDQRIDALASYTMSRAQVRVAADGSARLVLAADVQAGAENRSGVRWFDIADPFGTPSITQQGTFAPDDGTSRFIASPAVDASGNLAVSYSVAGPKVKPGVRYAARTPNDPPGRLTIGEGTLIEGEGVQTDLSRWGDYASLTVDPTDGCTFWLAGQFAPGAEGTAVDVVNFRLPDCTPTG
jgi:hypothetical protein